MLRVDLGNGVRKLSDRRDPAGHPFAEGAGADSARHGVQGRWRGEWASRSRIGTLRRVDRGGRRTRPIPIAMPATTTTRSSTPVSLSSRATAPAQASQCPAEVVDRACIAGLCVDDADASWARWLFPAILCAATGPVWL